MIREDFESYMERQAKLRIKLMEKYLQKLEDFNKLTLKEYNKKYK